MVCDATRDQFSVLQIRLFSWFPPKGCGHGYPGAGVKNVLFLEQVIVVVRRWGINGASEGTFILYVTLLCMVHLLSVGCIGW